MVSKRSRNIILEIFKKGAVRTIELSQMFKVTERTIRNDLEEIDYFLTDNGFDYLIRDAKKGIQLPESNLSTKLIYKLINEKDVVTASYSKEERVLEILYALSIHEKPMKIETLANELLVSKSTIVKDLDKIKEKITKETFQIRGSLEGIELVGNEASIRSWIVEQFVATMDKQTVLDIIALIEGENKITTYKVYWRLFENIELLSITHYVELLKSTLSTQLTDRLYLQVLGNFCLMYKRIAIGKITESKEKLHISDVSSHIIDFLYQVMKEENPLPETEKLYLHYIMQVSCCDLYEYEHRNEFNEIRHHANTLIHKMSIIMEYQQRDVLYRDIVKEIIAMMNEDELRIPNPKNVVELHDKVFEDVYTKIQEEVTWLNFQHHNVCSDDYWRLAWHFIANRKQYYRKKKVLIVSDKSKSLNNILIRKLKTMFDVEIIGVSAHAQMGKYIASYDIDCIIATMHVDSSMEIVRVHPLLSEADVQTLKQHLQTHMKENNVTIKESLISYEISPHSYDLKELVLQIENELKKGNIVNVDVGRELYVNISKQQENFLIKGTTFYMNLRNHEIVNKDAVVHVHLPENSICNKQKISKIEFYACKSSYMYIQYLEASLRAEGVNYEKCNT